MTDLIKVVDGVPRVDSRDIAKQIDVAHKSSVRLIKKHQCRFEELGIVRFENALKGTKGMPEVFVNLNEDQCYFLLTLSRNSEEVVKCKLRLVKDFGRLRRQAERRATLEWKQARLEGKIARRKETDTIKEFVEYATEQGSQNASKYYMNITRATYQALFMVEKGTKWEGIREMLDTMQISFVTTAEYVAAKGLKDGMKMGLHYKQIYQLAKSRLIEYSMTVGRTALIGNDVA